MEKAIDYLVGHPVLFVLAVIISIMILLPFFRSVMRLLLVAAALLVIYAAYLQFTGGSTHEAFQHIGLWVNNAVHFITSLFTHLFDALKHPKKELL
ncbi:MAG: hypothetical protein HGA59_03160 [Chlorobiaceae bacterium]|jgi:hypothetical protein|nr:hypothetical protein [Chlorobiaceae bacterium]NTV16266.1 hypothetical protein [Chlorobiaceae bacterium]